MKQIVILASLVLLSACGKSTWQEVPGTPPGNTNITITQPVTTTQSLIFANHGQTGTSENLYSTVTADSAKLMTLPASGLMISYQSASTKKDLVLTINGQYVCTYKWNGTAYAPHTTCIMKFQVATGDVMTVSGIPQAQTVLIPVSVVQK